MLFFEVGSGNPRMASVIDFIIIFLVAAGFNLIPFAGPSNMLIASNAALTIPNADPATLLIIGFVVALASALAKGVHYMITFFVSGRLSEKRRQKLDTDATKVKRWAFGLLFLVAATPLPDEPVVIPLGLMKYSPVKFFSAYFLGKLSIAVAGAFLGNFAGDFLSTWFTPEQTLYVSIGTSIFLTVIVTVLLFKVDFNKLKYGFGVKLAISGTVLALVGFALVAADSSNVAINYLGLGGLGLLALGLLLYVPGIFIMIKNLRIDKSKVKDTPELIKN